MGYLHLLIVVIMANYITEMGKLAEIEVFNCGKIKLKWLMHRPKYYLPALLSIITVAGHNLIPDVVKNYCSI